MQGLPARADSLSHSLAVSAAISGSSQYDIDANDSIEHTAQKVCCSLKAVFPAFKLCILVLI